MAVDASSPAALVTEANLSASLALISCRFLPYNRVEAYNPSDLRMGQSGSSKLDLPLRVSGNHFAKVPA